MRYLLLIPLIFILACSQDKYELGNEGFIFHRDLQNQDIRNILSYRDHRLADSLMPFLESNDPFILYELALAAASVEDKELGEKLLEKAGQTPYPEVRKVIYYAAGQSCDREVSDLLFALLKSEEDSSARIFAAEAIGKTGSGKELMRLMAMKRVLGPFALSNALYRFSLRNIYSGGSILKMISFLNPKYPGDVRIMASNMLARLKGEELVNHAKPLLAALKKDPLPEVRMNIATAFNKLNGNQYLEALADLAADRNEHFGVRVNAINSMNYYHYETAAKNVLPLLNDDNLKVQLEAAQFFLNRTMRDEWTEIAKMRDKIDTPQMHAKILAILLKYARNDEKEAVNSHIRLGHKNANDPFVKAFYIEALQNWPDNYKLLSQLAFLNDHLVTNSQAMASVFHLSSPDNFEQISDAKNPDKREECIAYFSEVFQRAILSGDPTLIGYGAKALRNKKIDFISRLEDTGFIETAISNLDLPRDVETLIDLRKTMAFIKGEELPNDTPPLNHFIDLDQLEEYASYHSARVNTNKGAFEIELDNLHCPATVANFIELSMSGFFDSLRFHRVENNFVVQGGCPRGDGWGSSGESIRSEFGPHFYKTGSVGMASAGKDTESCQWFVTHYPSVHLDGAYTNFARVATGMDVVYELAVGDTILGIEIN
jgi:cyclophilin family peptidyl-prolyl cis-trans isomerase/HEAT repeat protein